MIAETIVTSKDWWKESARDIPNIITELPGPVSKEMHASTSRHMRGLSSQVKLFPVWAKIQGSYLE